jgi:hypothetical protein
MVVSSGIVRTYELKRIRPLAWRRAYAAGCLHVRARRNAELEQHSEMLMPSLQAVIMQFDEAHLDFVNTLLE